MAYPRLLNASKIACSMYFFNTISFPINIAFNEMNIRIPKRNANLVGWLFSRPTLLARLALSFQFTSINDVIPNR